MCSPLASQGAVWSAKLNPTATRAATGAGDSTAKFWDATNGSELLNIDHKHVVKSVEFSPCHTRLATACDDKTLRLYDLSKPTEPIIAADLPAAPRAVLWAPDHKLLHVAAGEQVHTVEASSGSIVTSVDVGGEVRDLDWAQGGASLVVAAGKRASVLDVATLKASVSHELEYHPDSISMHPSDFSVFVTGSQDDVWVRMHSTKGGAELKCLEGHHGPVHAVRFSPCGSQFITGGNDASVRMWPWTGPPAAAS